MSVVSYFSVYRQKTPADISTVGLLREMNKTYNQRFATVENRFERMEAMLTKFCSGGASTRNVTNEPACESSTSRPPSDEDDNIDGKR